jgi:dephospho-CoA kinase
MLIVGLTGSIGMGKSTAASILKSFGLPVHNADQAVHALLEKGGKAVRPVAKIFPEAVKNNAIDRAVLGKMVFGKPAQLKKLEKILHPLVVNAERAFIKQAKRDGLAAVVLEIPLLFETGAEKRCDITICVSAPKAVQKARVLKRKGMTAARFKAILARQMPAAEKCRRADFVVGTGISRANTKRQLQSILQFLIELGSTHA